jgi:translation elongation factor P/translation initiation factor 5A
VAGPWFTVLRNGDDWKLVETIWVSDGRQAMKARVEMKAVLLPPAEEFVAR